MVLGSAIWFTALQAVVLKRFCPWCLAAHACGAFASVLVLLRVPVTDTPRDKDPAVAKSRLIRLSAIALCAVAIVGVAQTFAPGKTYTVTVVPPTATPTNVVARNILDVFNGRVRLDLAQLPVWGSPKAPHKLVSLFDYTCSHCREMHERVVAVQRSFGDRLAVVSLPMPLDSLCNPLITRTHPKQTNACEYARLGLSVWHARPDAIVPFDDWFFATPNPPALIDASNKAVQLVGAAALEQAARNPLIESQIKSSIELFSISMKEYGNGRMPQFMIGTNILTGTLPTEHLRAAVARYIEPAK